ncbi:ribosome recycling factor, partial [candidate division WOR-3 bacterium]|nr:ribosome recycling factor [candidate division WOR-3 bacterium]
WDPKLIPEIEKAILKSKVGLTPNHDGVAIKLPIPQLTEERRKDIVKMVRKITEDSRIGLRNIRREEINELKGIEGISDDDKYHGEREIQRITEKHIDKLNESLSQKEKEIMDE